MNEREVRELERQDRVEAVRHNRKMRKLELNMKRKKNSDSLVWVWEFSKKLVLICSVLYVISFFYSCVVMWIFFDFTYLGTFIEQASDILRTCVFGYFIKAGIENVIKIRSMSGNADEQFIADNDAGALIAPDGED